MLFRSGASLPSSDGQQCHLGACPSISSLLARFWQSTQVPQKASVMNLLLEGTPAGPQLCRTDEGKDTVALGGQWDEVCLDQGLEGWEDLERDTREKGYGQRVQSTKLVASTAPRGAMNKSACGKGVREGEAGRWGTLGKV